jgi:hypothetical protein
LAGVFVAWHVACVVVFYQLLSNKREQRRELLCPVGIIITIVGIQMSISNPLHGGGGFFALLGKRTLASSKRNGIFWSGDFGG